MHPTSPFNLRLEEYRTHPDPEKRGRILIQYASLAPHMCEGSPWVLEIESSRVFLRASAECATVNPRAQYVACGSALHYLEVGMRRFGRKPITRTFPDLRSPDLLAVVDAGPVLAPEPATLRAFEAILNRHPVGIRLDPRPVRGALVRSLLEDIDIHPGARIDILTDAAERIRLAQALADRGSPDVAGVTADGPVPVLLASRNDSKASRLEAGRVLAELLLAAAGRGLAARFRTEGFTSPESRARLHALAGPDMRVQAWLQVGYPLLSGGGVSVNDVARNIF